MAKPRSGPPLSQLSLLLIVGAAAAAGAFWLVDNRAAVRDSGIVIAILLGTYFICWSWALILYLRWRDRTRGVPADGTPYGDLLEGTVYGLVQGQEYRVMQNFTDYYANQFQRGELLRFKERHFLPYHGGHTIVFEGRALYLQETENQEILNNFSDYIARIER